MFLERPARDAGREVDVTGNAAVVKLELHRDGKRIFTDYLSLYQFSDGWKIVGKIYYRHS